MTQNSHTPSSSPPPAIIQVIISSDDEATPVYNPNDNQFRQQLELVHPHQQEDFSQEERKKREKINKMRMEMKAIQEIQMKEMEENREVLLKKKSKEMERMAEKKLRKEFESHSFLPTTSMASVKTKMAKYEQQCHFEVLPPEQKQFAKMRYDSRQKLTKVMLLAIEQLRLKNLPDMSQKELQFLDKNTDTLDVCYNLAKEVESVFFRKLRKSLGKPGQQYMRQIKLVVREFNDKNNLQFRRGILNRRLNLRQLSQAEEQQLKCQKTKQEDKAKMQQLIRQSQKDPIAAVNEMQPQEQSQPVVPQLNSFNSYPSATVMNRQAQEHEEENRKKQYEEIKRKNKGILKRCKKNMKNYMKEREERVRMLMENHLRNEYFAVVCDKVGI